MDRKNISVAFCAKIKAFEKINAQFTRCRCYVQALGKNRNRSYFDKAVVEEAIPTLFNIPVIGHIIEAEDGHRYMGGHDMEIELTEKGVSFRSLCVPYGVVPQQDGIAFETLTEPDGTRVEYLVADVILWTGRWSEIMDAAYGDDTYFNESMEICVDEWRDLEEDKNYLEVQKFSYSALCLLGKADDKNSAEHTEPCFPLSCVVPYSIDVSAEEFTALMSQLKEELAFSMRGEPDKGGKRSLLTDEVRDAVLQEFNLTLADTGIVITEEMTEEEFRNSVKEYADAHAGDTPPATPAEHAATYSYTVKKKRCALENAFCSEYVRDEEGNVVAETHYYVVDFDDEFVYVERWMYTADDYRDDYGRYSYTFNEDCSEATISGEFEEMTLKWLTKEEDDRIEQDRIEMESLREFKEDRLKADHEADVDSALAEFTDLSSNEEFEELRATAYSYKDIGALKTACFAIRGKIVTPQHKVNEPAVNKQPLTSSGSKNADCDRYGDLFARFGRK